MHLINRLLFKFSAFLRCRIIRGPNNEPYLERYHLLRLPFGIHIYLHRFVASDPGRALHNHPWRLAFALVLSGCYHETRLVNARNGERLRKRRISAGCFNFISGRIYHRINLPPGGEAWTLFMHTASHRSWGFLDVTQRRFNYTDHNSALSTSSNPGWWKDSLRPLHAPDIRMPLRSGS